MVGSERLVDRYEFREVLGAGGMGVVHRAFDVRLGREVAVKVVDLSCASETQRVRFEREALAVGRLRSAHVVTVYDVGEDIVDGVHVGFLVMDLLEGGPLNSVLTVGLPPWEDVVGWGRQMSRGLRDAHARGVVHRDVKPSNVIISPQGSVTLVDFGIARIRDAARETVTVPGTAVGTPPYMAPERLRGEPADERCDLYGLGCVLYELLTGQPPFGRGTVRPEGVEPTPVREERPDVPVALENLLLELLRVNPADRPDAAETEQRLDAIPVSRTGANGTTSPATVSWDTPARTTPRRVSTLPRAVPSASPSTAAQEPATAPAALRSAAARAALTGATMLWGQLVLFTALPFWSAAMVAAAAGMVLALLFAPPGQPELQPGTGPLAAMCTTGMVSIYLIGWSTAPWWGILATAVFLSPALIALGILVGAVTARLTGCGKVQTDAGVTAGLLSAAVSAIALLGVRQPAAAAVMLGSGIWLATALLSTAPLEPRAIYRGRHR